MAVLLASCGSAVAPAVAISPYTLYLTPNDATVPVSSTLQLAAYSADMSGNLTLARTAGVTWTSEDITIASVNGIGDVDLKSQGVTAIQGMIGSTTAQSKLYITSSAPALTGVAAVQGIVLNSHALWNASAIFADGSVADVTTHGVWISTDNNVISIDPLSGMAKFLQTSGQAYITFQYGSFASTKLVILK